MANKQVVFSDRIVGLSVQNGLVRIDLATIAGPAKTKEGKDGLKMDVTHQLVMPMDAFVAGFGMQQKLIRELSARQQKRSLKAPAAPEATAAAEQAAAAS
ncbi:hypothetical protein [Aquabacterium sp.]|uniref:hypothetical protein n=1 Tax=Aquabacterium sp. TaxID=1872578 RepID=UPI003783DECD